MTIRLEKLVPLPILELPCDSSGIWEAESVIFREGKNYLVEAPSGKGKTSLLSVIFGIRKDYQGSVFLDDRDISSVSGREWSMIRKEKLSFIFQGLELFDELTALENIRLKNSITGFRTEEEIMEQAEKLEIGGFMEKKAGILSFGQQQRVAIIRALSQPFEFLLADECFSHMDRQVSMTALDLIQEECRRQGAGMIMTSLNGTVFAGMEETFTL
jgi:putative ABC transport system ATP-binding protein